MVDFVKKYEFIHCQPIVCLNNTVLMIYCEFATQNDIVLFKLSSKIYNVP